MNPTPDLLSPPAPLPAADAVAESGAASPAARWLDEHGDALYGFALLRVRDA